VKLCVVTLRWVVMVDDGALGAQQMPLRVPWGRETKSAECVGMAE
jgi:hypothetical protein